MLYVGVLDILFLRIEELFDDILFNIFVYML